MPDFSLELKIGGLIAGIDEVGMGPWAGPVVACAVIIDQTLFPINLIPFIDDSKKLSQKKREEIYNTLIVIPDNIFTYSIGSASVEEIDSLNIRQAALLAMSRAIQGLKVQPEHCLIDGNMKPKFNIPSTSVIKGDSISLSIAAASIIAKVKRDNLMCELSKSFPEYRWSNNAGYGTKDHQKAIRELGITLHHRKSFKPISQIIEERKKD